MKLQTLYVRFGIGYEGAWTTKKSVFFNVALAVIELHLSEDIRQLEENSIKSIKYYC